MGASVNLTLPASWSELTDSQLRFVFLLLSGEFTAPEVKTLCLLRWNKIRVIAKSAPHTFLVKFQGKKITLSSSQINAATSTLDFLDTFPDFPVRISTIHRHKALPADFEGVSFEKYLILENLFQGYLHTQKQDLLEQMAGILYQAENLKPNKSELTGVFYWFAALKQYFSKLFPNFYTPATTDQNTLATQSLYQQLREASNAQIRALTGGDVTKENTILQTDTIRALTELDAKAQEAAEIRKKYKD